MTLTRDVRGFLFAFAGSKIRLRKVRSIKQAQLVDLSLFLQLENAHSDASVSLALVLFVLLRRLQLR